MKTFLLFVALTTTFFKYSEGQIICILCYDQNDSISYGVNNLLQNGGFENGTCVPGYIGDVYCPSSASYSCDIPNWTCTGGGSGTYSCLFNNATDHSIIVEGTKAAYFGNWYCQACSPYSNDTSCLVNIDCTVSDLPPGYPVNDISHGGTTGLSLSQTANGLVPGNTYVLEFWTGGEQWSGLWPNDGLFGLDVGFGDTLLRCPASPNIGGIGRRFIVEFNAVAASQTIKFTNWGHICSNCTELVLDDVKLYTLAELSSTVPSCGGSFGTSSFASSDTILCEKFCINFFDSSNNNPTAWQWIFPGGTPSSSSDQNPTNICYQVPGIYDVTLITTTASGNDTLTLSNYITVNPTPAFPTITQVGYTLTSSTANHYQWQFNSVNIPGATNQSYTVTQTGFYTVVIADENGCVNSTTQYVLITGVDVVSNANISIHPNPSSGSFIVEGLGGFAGEVSIDVVNAIGQKVFSSADRISDSHFEKEIDLSAVARGVYFIEIKTENIFLRTKVITVK